MSEPADPARRRARLMRNLKLGAGLAVSILCVWALLNTVRPAQVGAALAHARPAWLAFALAGVAAAYLLKILRWNTMLEGLGARPRFGDVAAGLLGCVALNNILPFRAGDVVRVVAFERLTQVAPAAQLGTLILERLLDLAALMLLLFVGLSLRGSDGFDPTLLAGLRLAAGVVIVGVVGFVLAPGPIRLLAHLLGGRVPRLRPATATLLRVSDAIETLARPALLARLGGFSLAAWLCEGLAFFAVGVALGVPLGAAGTLLTLGLATLSTMIPSSPGYVGTFHVAAALAVARFGAAPAEAAAYAILIHALLWLSTTAAGLLLMSLAGMGVRRTPAASAAPQPEG